MTKGLSAKQTARKLLSDFPDLVAQWDYERNDALHQINDKHPVDPEALGYGSNYKVGWVCTAGHKWDAVVGNRARLGRGCPECAKKNQSSVTRGVRARKNPLVNAPVAAWWSDKNERDISEMSAGSSDKAFFRCDNGHEWLREIRAQVKKGKNCTICERGPFLKDGYPELETMYSQDENRLAFNELHVRQNTKVMWHCPDCSMSFSARPRKLSFTKEQTGATYCLVCAGHLTVPEVNTLDVLAPELKISALNYEDIKNETRISLKKIVYRCGEGHVSNVRISSYVGPSRSRCKVCTKKRLGKERRLKAASALSLKDALPEGAEWLDTNSFNPTEISPQVSQTIVHIKYTDCGHYRSTNPRNITKSPACPACNKGNPVSKAEEDIADYVQGLLEGTGISMVRGDRTALGDKTELDIYIPELSVAFEYNGLYWHSEMVGKDKSYHLAKYLSAADKGIQLFYIWEDEWRDKEDIVKRMIRHKLGLNNQAEKVHGRNTVVTEISKAEAEEFLNTNHIQGFAKGNKYLGLLHKEELVAVMVLEKYTRLQNYVNISRYATSKKVPGGFSKLVAYAEKQIPNLEGFVSFSDNGVSDGGLYANNGFILDAELKPDYKYLVSADGKKNRYHKFNYRLKRFREDPNLLFEEGRTEAELAAMNGLVRIWDAGKVRWVLPVG